MKVNYSFDVLTELQYSKVNIQKTLAVGKDLEFSYIRNYIEEVVSVNEALEIILTTPEDEPPTLTVKVEGIFIILSIENDNGYLKFGIGSYDESWERRDIYTGEYDIDTSRYLRLLLKLSHSFKVKKIEIDTF